MPYLEHSQFGVLLQNIMGFEEIVVVMVVERALNLKQTDHSEHLQLPSRPIILRAAMIQLYWQPHG